MRSPILGRACVLAVALACAAGLVLAQRTGVHPVSGRVYAPTMGAAGAPWLDRAERVDEEAPERALRFLRVPRGATVADVGAGSGYFTVRLARAVGPTGRVYASDIQPEMLALVSRNAARAKVTNVIPVLGTQTDPRLPDGAIDLVIMVDVYHEFAEPQAMLRRLHQALAPQGRLVLLEYRAEDPAVPIRPEHKMTRAQVRLEVEHEGFVLAESFDGLPRQHLLVFRKAPPPAAP